MEEQVVNLKRRLQESCARGIALDIDEVLSNTVFYLMDGLREKFGSPEGLSTQQLIDKYTFTFNVPYYNTKDAQDWVFGEINRNELQPRLPLIENANHSVNKLHKIVPIVAYVTKRPLGVLSGTKEWLSRHGFPHAEIICKPEEVHPTDGNFWKLGVLNYLYPQVLGIVDDDYRFAEAIGEYKGLLWLFGYANFESTSGRIVPCKDWDLVRNWFLKNKV